MRKSKKQLLLAIFIPIFIMLIVFAVWGQYPFGDNTMLIWDMDWQYCSFFCHLHDILHGDASFLYSFSRAIGGDMIGVAAYYLISPFNLIFYFFDIENVYIGLLILVLAKIGTSGLTMNLYLNYRALKKSQQDTMFTLLFSTAYALSSYTVAYFFNIMWFDAILILPIVVWGIEKIVDSQNYLMYPIALGYAIMTNFYTGYMVCIFSVFYFLCYYFLISDVSWNAKKRIKAFVGYILTSLLGGMLAAWIAIPAAYSMSGGKKNINLDLLKDFTKYYSYEKLFPQTLFGGMSDRPALEGNPRLYCGVLILLLAIGFFFSHVKLRKKAAYAILIGIMIFSFTHINAVEAWQAFNLPNGCDYRYSFVYIFIIVQIAAETSPQFISCLVECKYKRWHELAVVCCITLGIVFSYGYFKESGKSTLWFINIAIIVIYAIVLLFPKIRKNQIVILLLLLSVELGSYAGYYFLNSICFKSTSKSEFDHYVEQVSGLIETMQEDTSLYRAVLSDQAFRTKDDNFMFNIYGMDSYTSVERETTLNMAMDFGFYKHSIFGIHYNEGVTEAVDALLGIKYRITDKKPGELYSLVERDGTLELYENSNAFGFAILSDANILEVENIPYKSAKYINNIYAGLARSVSNPVLKWPEHTVLTIDNCQLDDQGNYRCIDSNKKATIWFQIDTDVESEYYLNPFDSSVNNIVVILNGEVLDINSQANATKKLGHLNSDDDLQMIVEMSSGQQYSVESSGIFYEDTDTLRNYVDILNQEKPDVTMKKESRLLVSGENPTDYTKYLVFTIPYDEGWTLRDSKTGETVQKEIVLGNMIAVEVPPGTYEYVLTFVPKGLLLGVGLTGAALLVIVLYGGIFRRKKWMSVLIE